MVLQTTRRSASWLARHMYLGTRNLFTSPVNLTLAASASIVCWFVASSLRSDSVSFSHQSSLHTSATDQSNHLKESPTSMSGVGKAREQAFWGMFAGDALSMPVHWYYDTDDIKRHFDGWLTGYVAPRKKHPSSILTISAIGGAGRSTFSTGKEKSIIGDVILHDKLKYWTKNDRTIHYHQGMSAGDNTLDCHCAAMSAIQASGLGPSATEDQVLTAIMTDYVGFMTKPGSHSDTYASSCHREFFKSWSDSGSPRDPEKLMAFVLKRKEELEKKHLDHNIDAISALVHPIPTILHYANQSEDIAARQAVKLVRMTHASVNLDPFVDTYARILHAVLNGASLKDKVKEALTAPPIGNQRTWKIVEAFSGKASEYAKGSEKRLEVYQNAVGQMGLACYMKGAMTSMLFLAYEFHNDFEQGVLTNANCGGESCGRGSALGALLGAEAGRTGTNIPKQYITGLHSLKPKIEVALNSWGSQ